MIPDVVDESNDISKKNWKVGRNIEKYGLDDLDEELVRRWTGHGREQNSLRELAEFFNKSMLKAAMQDAGMSVHDRELDYQYKILTDKNVTSGMRIEVTRNLEKHGVDFESVEDDFVTHQAIYTYLSNYHNADYESESEDQLEKDLNTINQLKSRTNTVIESTIERLNRTDRISIGDEDVIVNVTVICNDCGRSYEVSELLSEGSCDCDESA